MAGITAEVLLGIMAVDRLSSRTGEKKHTVGGGFESYTRDNNMPWEQWDELCYSCSCQGVISHIDLQPYTVMAHAHIHGSLGNWCKPNSLKKCVQPCIKSLANDVLQSGSGSLPGVLKTELHYSNTKKETTTNVSLNVLTKPLWLELFVPHESLSTLQ